jgi:hypothetical protein
MRELRIACFGDKNAQNEISDDENKIIFQKTIRTLIIKLVFRASFESFNMAKSKYGSPDSSKASGSATKRRSPLKAGKAIPVRKKKTPMNISCINFAEEFQFEIYIFEKAEGDDGFLNGVRKYMRGDETEVHAQFDEANFTQVLDRREPGSNDKKMTNASNNYDRKIILRYPREGKSTPETRQKGLKALKAFLMDSRFMMYPPDKIETFDLTNHDEQVPMDSMMMNGDIKDAVVHAIAEEELISDFKDNYPELADCIWQSPHVGIFGQSLGF